MTNDPRPPSRWPPFLLLPLLGFAYAALDGGGGLNRAPAPAPSTPPDPAVSNGIPPSGPAAPVPGQTPAVQVGPPAPPPPGSTPAEVESEPAGWFVSNDYRFDALAKGEQGRTRIAFFRIETDGQVRSCRVLESSGSASLDAASCYTLVLRARYRPARGAAGNPVATEQTRAIRWVLPHNSLTLR